MRVHVYVYMNMHVQCTYRQTLWVYMHMRMYVCLCVCVCVCARAYRHTPAGAGTREGAMTEQSRGKGVLLGVRGDDLPDSPGLESSITPPTQERRASSGREDKLLLCWGAERGVCSSTSGDRGVISFLGVPISLLSGAAAPSPGRTISKTCSPPPPPSPA